MNAAAHRLIGAAAMAVAGGSLSPRREETAAHVVAGRAGGYCFGTLPDLIEPPTSPHHRQFFHSVVLAGVMGYGLYRLRQWDPGSPELKVLRMIGLIAGGTYLVHLMLNVTTKRSMPFLRRLQ